MAGSTFGRCPGLPSPFVFTDDEAEDIRKKLDARWRGPVLLWLEQLLQDRDERRHREREAEAEEPPQP